MQIFFERNSLENMFIEIIFNGQINLFFFWKRQKEKDRDTDREEKK